MTPNPHPWYQVYFCDGTVPNLPRGWYWRRRLGIGHYGPSIGPFETEQAAIQAAERSDG